MRAGGGGRAGRGGEGEGKGKCRPHGHFGRLWTGDGSTRLFLSALCYLIYCLRLLNRQSDRRIL